MISYYNRSCVHSHIAFIFVSLLCHKLCTFTALAYILHEQIFAIIDFFSYVWALVF